MKADAWDDMDDSELPGLARDSSMEPLLRDSPAGRLYCQLGEFDLGDND
jgi:hypothetical protein